MRLIQNRLQQTWSPERIAGRETQLGVSFKTIYNWLYNGILPVSLQTLRRKGTSRKPRETRGTFRVGRSIHARPNRVENRTEFGHWELDTVVSSRGKSKVCVATFLERKTRFYIPIRMANRTARSMWQAIQQVVHALPAGFVQTVTADRGKEFACYAKVEKRGSNENSNDLFREFFPKRTDFSSVSDSDIFHAFMILNHRPRKCLQFKPPFEALLHELEVSH